MARVLIPLLFSYSALAMKFEQGKQYNLQGRIINNQFVIFYKTNNEQKFEIKNLVKSKKYEGLEVSAKLAMKKDCRYDCTIKMFDVIDILPSLQKLP